jgi:hypothetical protein
VDREWNGNNVVTDDLTENDQVRLILRFNEGEPEPDIASLSKNLAERNISLKVEKQITQSFGHETAGNHKSRILKRQIRDMAKSY